MQHTREARLLAKALVVLVAGLLKELILDVEQGVHQQGLVCGAGAGRELQSGARKGGG
jgi:hypothetical protein